ncbi:MAG: phosphoglucomutase/phosphomannomutase family protein [Acidobacteriota bacterium]
MSETVHFGTDGWRGRIGFDFNVENLRRVAAATANHFSARGVRSAVVGFDRRFLSGRFARQVAEVFGSLGVHTLLSGCDLPTPALSWAVASRQPSFGVMITASHNPPEFNGYKIKDSDGASIEDATAHGIESRLLQGAPSALPAGAPPPEPAVEDLLPPYLAALSERVDLERIRARDWTIVSDAMHGCGGNLLELLLRGGRARVRTLRGTRDVLFGGQPPEPTPEHLREAASLLASGQASVGLATDGDGDRIAALDENGTFVGAQILTPLLALHLHEARGARGAVAKTFAHTVLLDRVASELGVSLHVRPIGFKHLAALMRTEPILVCGEESGGIGVAGFLPERDGLLCALLVLEDLCLRNVSLAQAASDLRRRFGDYHYLRVDLRSEPQAGRAAVERLAAQLPSRIGGLSVRGVDRLDGLKCLFGDDGWILFRQSGTEPVLRVYTEVRGRQYLQGVLDQGVEMLARHLPAPPQSARQSPSCGS